MPIERTPALRSHWTLDPEITFLNHGSFGACPTFVLEHQRELRARIEREPVLFLARQAQGLLDDVREELARFLGATPANVVPVANATTGVNAILRSLTFAPGDELLVTNHGYNACKNAVDYVAERAGARAVVAEVPFPIASPDDVVEAVLERVTDRTRLALIDHVTSPTGLVFPIERLIPLLRERGVETLVDGAHAPGMLALELDALDPAYYTGNAHKWMCTPKGAAFLYVRSELQAGLRPAVISHGANAPLEAGGRSRFQLEFDWTGTDDPTAWFCIPTALEFLGGLYPGGWSELRMRNRALVLGARRLLCETLGLEPPAPEAMIGSLATVLLPPAARTDEPPSAFRVDPLQDELFTAHHIEVPVFTWPQPPERLLRVSAQAYNTLDDYERLCRALPGALARA